MFCRKCGKEIDNSSKFCPYCGGEIRGINTPDNKVLPDKKKTNWKAIMVPVSVAVITAAVIGSVFFFINKSDFSDKKGVENESSNYTDAQSDRFLKENQEQMETEDATEQGSEEGIEVKNEYILPDSDSRYLSMTDLAGFTAEDCKLARNELFARHGRRFLDETLQAYFDSKSWYAGTIEPEDFNDEVFNEYEIANRDLIVQYETEQGYRQESINDDIKSQLADFVEVLGWASYGKDTKPDIDTPEFVYSFLRWALHRDMQKKRIQDQYPYKHTYEHGEIYPDIALISEEVAKKFLLDSIGRYDSLQFGYLDGCVMAIMGDTGTSGVKDVVIENISKQSDSNIRLEGTLIRYHEIEEEICRFDITMTENADSIWGGYTLKAINSWKWEEK